MPFVLKKDYHWTLLCRIKVLKIVDKCFEHLPVCKEIRCLHPFLKALLTAWLNVAHNFLMQSLLEKCF